MTKPIAIICSDIHLSDRAPSARSTEPDWYAAMARPLQQLSKLKEDLDVPVIVAGDIFHKWNPSPKLINFAIDRLPPCMAVPGQHDLRYHSLDDIESTGFWTLVKIGTIQYMNPKWEMGLSRTWIAYGVPWGVDPKAPEGPGKHLAIVHMFVCSKDTAYPGAPEEAFYPKVRRKFWGFDAAFFGDNHKPFESLSEKGCTIYNCGALIRRTHPERTHSPSVGILFEDGRIDRHFLDCSEDLFSEPLLAIKKEGPDMADFLDGLREADERGSEDFRSSVRRWADREEVSSDVKELLLRAVEDGD